MAFSWSSKVCRVKIGFLLGNVGTFPRNAILMGDKISWRSLLQRTFQVSAGTLPLLLPTSLITHDIVIKLAAGVKVTILEWYFQRQGQRPQQRGNPPMHQRWWLEISLGNWNNNYTLPLSLNHGCIFKVTFEQAWSRIVIQIHCWLWDSSLQSSFHQTRAAVVSSFLPKISKLSFNILLKIWNLSSKYEYSVFKS